MAFDRSSRMIELPEYLWDWLDHDIAIFKSVSRRIESLLITVRNDEYRSSVRLNHALGFKSDRDYEEALRQELSRYDKQANNNSNNGNNSNMSED